jgi:lysophospholipase L1-like esterase
MSTAQRVARVVGGVLAAAAIFAATGEMLARAFHLVDWLNGFPRRLFIATDDPHLPYVLRPGVDTMVRGFHVRVNAEGLRGPPVTREPAPGVHRVLALGDSATFGEGLAVEEAFPALLERDLNAAGRGRWEVLNAGVEGYNTEAEAAYLERRGLAFDPEVVVVGFNLNDYDYAPVLGPLGVLTGDPTARISAHSLANHSEFLLLLRGLVAAVERARYRAAAPPPEPAPAPERFDAFDRFVSALRKAYWRHPTDGRWQTMVDALRRLGTLTRARGIRLVIAILPDGDQIGVPDPDLTPQQKVVGICAEAGLDCLDLYAAFAAAGDRPLFLDIMHPNAAGQRIVARELAAHLLGGRWSSGSMVVVRRPRAEHVFRARVAGVGRRSVPPARHRRWRRAPCRA